jgi:hypothetical protein
MYKIFWPNNLKDREHLEVLSADERITLNWMFLAQERGEWLELVRE